MDLTDNYPQFPSPMSSDHSSVLRVEGAMTDLQSCVSPLPLISDRVCSLSRVQLCDPMDWGLPGFSVHGISQARILEWVAISSTLPCRFYLGVLNAPLGERPGSPCS